MAVAADVPAYGRKVLGEEKRAASILSFNSSVLPGLLQTDDYASALFTESMPGTDAKKIALLVATRAQRRSVLRAAAPPSYLAVVDEAALRRPMGGPAVMAGQLRHTLDVIENHRAVRVRVLPFSCGEHPLLGGSLSLLTQPDGTAFAYVESFASGVSVVDAARVRMLTTMLDVARSKALDNVKSATLIRDYAKEYEGAHPS
ncbi:DUF5753 domain-containing protein [Streptomyces sp. NPDC001515]